MFLDLYIASPRASEVLGSVLGKVMNGWLGNKAWPHSAITVGEAPAEFSYRGVEAMPRCCKHKEVILNGWLDCQHSKSNVYISAFLLDIHV